MRSNGKAYSNHCSCGAFANCIEQRPHADWCPQKEEFEAYAAGHLAALREVLAEVDALALDESYSGHHQQGFKIAQSMTRVLLDALIAREEGK